MAFEMSKLENKNMQLRSQLEEMEKANCAQDSQIK